MGRITRPLEGLDHLEAAHFMLAILVIWPVRLVVVLFCIFLVWPGLALDWIEAAPNSSGAYTKHGAVILLWWVILAAMLVWLCVNGR